MNDTASNTTAQAPAGIFRRIAYYMNPSKMDPKRRNLWIFWILFNVGLVCLPNDLVRGSILCLLPTVGLFIYAIVSRNVYEAIVLGTLANYLMWYKGGFLYAFVENVVASVCEPDTSLMIISFLLCGGMIVMFTRSGVTKSFGDLIVRRFGSSDKLVLTSAGIFTGAMSVDDYIASLTSGAAFSPLMDAMKRPRMALSFIIKTFSTCVSCLLPFGAWGFFIIYQIAAAENVNGLDEAAKIFYSTIPYQIFPIVACVICLLFAWGKFPRLGKMKTAYEQAEQGIQFGAADAGDEEDDSALIEEMIKNDPRKQNVSVWNLIIPMVLLVISMFAFDFNGFLCFLVPMLVSAVLYICQGIFSLSEYIDCYIQGCRDMMDMTLILVMGYSLGAALEAMEFSDFMLNVCSLVPLAALLPFVFFVYFGLQEYLMTMNYTLFLILFPTLMVVLPEVGANVPMCLAAIISAGLFGANTCVISDLGVIAAKSCRVKIFDQFVACQPYYWICYGITAAGYLILGFIF